MESRRLMVHASLWCVIQIIRGSEAQSSVKYPLDRPAILRASIRMGRNGVSVVRSAADCLSVGRRPVVRFRKVGRPTQRLQKEPTGCCSERIVPGPNTAAQALPERPQQAALLRIQLNQPQRVVQQPAPTCRATTRWGPPPAPRRRPLFIWPALAPNGI